MQVTVLGYVSRDRNILPDGQETEQAGGKGLYTSAALAMTGVETNVITWLPVTDQELLDRLQEYPVTVYVIPIATGTTTTNHHQGNTTVATASFDPYVITPKDLDIAMELAIQESQLIHLAPDIQDKISLELIKHITDTIGVKISADLGKYFRARQPDGTLTPKFPWPEQAQYLRYFDIVFMSEEDIAPMLTSGESLLSVAREMSEQGPNEIIITRGSQGAFVYVGDTNEAYDIPAFVPKKIVDPTGAGDTFIGAYLAHRLLTDEILSSGKFAAMAASVKLNYSGPLRETAETIEQHVKEQS